MGRKLVVRNMKYLPLILRNVFRNKRRTILTILSIGVSLFLISTLRTMLASLESPLLTPESANRVVTRHQTSLGNPLPIAYRNRIQTVPGVKCPFISITTTSTSS